VISRAFRFPIQQVYSGSGFNIRNCRSLLGNCGEREKQNGPQFMKVVVPDTNQSSVGVLNSLIYLKNCITREVKEESLSICNYSGYDPSNSAQKTSTNALLTN
jgi:hypothetical protein